MQFNRVVPLLSYLVELMHFPVISENFCDIKNNGITNFINSRETYFVKFPIALGLYNILKKKKQLEKTYKNE